MKLSVLSNSLGHLPLRQALEFFSRRGVQEIEIGCGGYPGKDHCDPDLLLKDASALKEFKSAFADYGLKISALSCHGNPVHPDPDTAAEFHRQFEQAVFLAEQLEVRRVVGFSGCPGGSPVDRQPNWVVYPWPPEFTQTLDYQWNEVLIPYWSRTAEFAQSHGVDRIALEMHPGFCVYNPETLMKLRGAAGPVIGANLDPSHLFWQGMDLMQVIRYLGEAIHFFHAKDTALDALNTARNGVLDWKPFDDPSKRAWVFRTVGYGHDAKVWKDIIMSLRMAGYDGPISIEHEDGLMTSKEGLEKAIRFLQEVMLFEPVS